MNTDKRLTRAYKNARIDYFNDDSKYIIFSDLHRGNGSHFDEFSKNQNVFRYALEYYFANGYTYIEAGDGDELWENPRVADIKNAHIHIFETIKIFNHENRLILIYGNHNSYLKDMDYVKKHYYTNYNEYKEAEYEFLMGVVPIEALILKHIDSDQEMFVLHGHQGDFLNDQLWYPTMVALKYFWRYLHSFGIRNPASPVKNTFKRHRIEKNFKKWIEKNKKILICGHTHRFKFPKDDDLPYFNTGSGTYPTIITGIEISNGNIQLVRWKTEPDSNGFLKVNRAVLRGPKSIEYFDMRT